MERPKDTHTQEHLPTPTRIHPTKELENQYKEQIQAITNLKLQLGRRSKPELILVLLGAQRATNLYLDENDDTPENIKHTLEATGLYAIADKIETLKNKTYTNMYVGHTQEDAEKMRESHATPGKNDELYGQLMGYLQTAIDAFLGRIPRLPAQHSAYASLRPDHGVIFQITLSKDHWQEEVDYLRRQSNLIAQCAPEIYQNRILHKT